MHIDNSSKKSKIIKFVLFIIVLFVIFIGYFIYSDLEQEKILIQELENVMKLDLSEDVYEVDIKTKGNYAIIEEVLKTYFYDLSNNIKDLDNVLSDGYFSNVLSIENYDEDGPFFEKSFAKISEVRNKTILLLDNISEMVSFDYMSSLIEEYNLSSYYVNFYNNLLYDSSDNLQELYGYSVSVINFKDSFLKFLDDCDNILKFLKDNQGMWIIEDNSLVFESVDLLNQYNNLCDRLVEDGSFDESFLE